MKIMKVESEEEFIKLKDDWNKIVNQMEEATPFQTWELNYYYWKYNEHQSPLNILIAICKGKLIGIAPIVNHNGTIRFIGGDHVDYGGFIVYQNMYRVVSLFLKTLEDQNWKRIELKDFCSRYTQIHLLRRLYENNSKAYFQQTKKTVTVPIKKYSNWDEFYQFLSKNMKKNDIKPVLKIKHQYLELKEFNLKTAQDISEIFKLRQEQRIGKSNIDWFIPIAAELHKTNQLYTMLIKSENETYAFGTIFRFKTKRYTWVSTFNPKISGIGHLLEYYLIRHSFNENVTDVDLMRGDYDYKVRWAGEVYTNYHFILFRSTFQKLLFAMKIFIRKKISHFIFSHKLLKKIYMKLSKISFKETERKNEVTYYEGYNNKKRRGIY